MLKTDLACLEVLPSNTNYTRKAGTAQAAAYVAGAVALLLEGALVVAELVVALRDIESEVLASRSVFLRFSPRLHLLHLRAAAVRL